jgi:enolase-phosphatase E1
MIWAHGYAAKAFTTRMYPDVQPSLEAWKRRGLKLGIYSSGSVAAQKLLFAHTETGDLTPLLSDYFDTGVGAKREAEAYGRILEELCLPGWEVAFLSDVPEELDAARAHGIMTVQLVRPGTKAGERHPTAATFAEVDQVIATN